MFSCDTAVSSSVHSKGCHINWCLFNSCKGRKQIKSFKFQDVLDMRVHLCPFACIMISMSLGAFSSLSYVQGQKVEKVQWGRSDLTKPIIAFISVLELWMVLIDQNELPQPNEKEGGREGGRNWKSKRDWKGKSRRNSLPFLPWGVQCVGGVLYVSLASVSPVFHLRKSLKPNEVPAEEFLHPAKVCVFLCSTHLLLIKQWQAVKMLFDRNCGN